MTQEVKRSYLEINSLKDLKEVQKPSSDYSLKLLDPVNFQLNKFFYKNVGKKHKWIDRLVWEESKWIEYVSNKNVKTYIFKKENDLVGFFELLEHTEKKEIEIAYFGLLEEYHNKKLGSYLLSMAIKKSFEDISLPIDFNAAFLTNHDLSCTAIRFKIRTVLGSSMYAESSVAASILPITLSLLTLFIRAFNESF